MKATLTLLSCVCAFGLAQAQMVPVTFAVDMNGAANFNPDADTLRIAGSLQGWTPRDPSGDNILTDGDGDGVYDVTLDLMPGDYEYKYVINIWDPEGFNEASGSTPITSEDVSCFNGGGNRPLTVTADGADVPVYEYNSCVLSTVSGTRDFTALAGVSVGPNPAVDYATVSLPAGGRYGIRVVDATGRVLSEVSEYERASYELSGLATGLYTVEVTDAARGRRAVVRVSFQ